MVLLILVYLLLNTSLNLLNKWALGHYGMAFPLTLTSAHMSFSFIVLAPFAMRVPMETHVRTLEKQWKGLVCIGAFLALNIALNNISLIDISLSLNQVIRSSIPVVTCLLAIVVEGKVPGEREGWSLVMLTVGVMIAVWQGTVAGKPHAIVYCVVGTVCNAAMMTFSGKLLSEKLDVVRLTFYTAPVSLLCLAPFMVYMELDAFRIYFEVRIVPVFCAVVVVGVVVFVFSRSPCDGSVTHSFVRTRDSLVLSSGAL